MKKINYYLGALALASLSLASCSDDKIAPDEPQGPDTDVERTVYLNVAINTDGIGGSRTSLGDGNPQEGTDNAGDFDNGEGTENTVNTIYLVFYDTNGNVLGNVVPIENKFEETAAPNGTIQSQSKNTVTLTLQQGDPNPTQVICYVNPANPGDLLRPLTEVQTTTRDAVTVKGTAGEDGTVPTYFPMSNSVYYPAGATEGTTAEKPITAVQIPAESIFQTLKEAEDELEVTDSKKIIDIYVERYAAKVKMLLAEDAIKDYTTWTTGDGVLGTTDGAVGPEVKLTFHIKGWDVNGEAKNTYAVKSFRQATQTGQIANDDYTYDLLDGRINALNFSYESGTVTNSGTITGPWKWNNYGYHRSYWACSPVYFQAEYPEVLSDYLVNGAVPETSNQIFRSWNEIAASNKSFNTPYYYKETTSGIPALKSKNPNAAIPTIALVGEYTFTINGTELKDDEGNSKYPTFYTYLTGRPAGSTVDAKPLVYFKTSTETGKSEVAESEIEGGLSMHKRFLWQTTVLYHNVAGEGQPAVFERLSAGKDQDLRTLVAATTIARPSNTVLGNVKMTSVARTLQLVPKAADDYSNLAGIFVNQNGKPKQVVADNVENFQEATQIKLSDANRLLWRNVGTCNLYEEAAGKFTIPVKHLGWYRTGNDQKDATTIDMSKAHVGDFGLVRNHSYTINVTEISGLAAGIGGKKDPIIPPADTKDVYMAYRINVLRWAVVPTQKVEL